MYKTILFELKDRIATITFNRPDRLNAINTAMREDFSRLFDEIQTNEEIGVIIFTGEGRAFSAGGDIEYFERDWNTTRFRAENHRLTQFFDELELIEKPVLAAINGPCTGAGLQITLSCDLRIASDQAKFGTAYAKVGYGGDFGTTWLLTHYAGAPKAKELLMLGDIIDAAEAHRIGLVNRVVAHEGFESEVRQVAARIADGPLTSFRYMKANINLATHTDFRTLLDREAETHLRCGQTDDHKEGVRAFLEKRAPKFTGR